MSHEEFRSQARDLIGPGSDGLFLPSFLLAHRIFCAYQCCPSPTLTIAALILPTLTAPPSLGTRVADDESRHLGWCLQRLGELGHDYGDMAAHNLLWEGALMSAGDLNARWVMRGGGWACKEGQGYQCVCIPVSAS